MLDPNKVAIYNENMSKMDLAVISTFRQIAKRNPFYKKYLQRLNIDQKSIKTIQDFKNSVPILNKEKLFTSNLLNIKEICLDGNLKDCQSILPSSGHSGAFSFGLTTEEELRTQEESVDLILDYAFNTTHKNTLLINCLSMGINISATKMTLVNTGPRSDIVISIIKTFAKEFEQIIMVGDNSFIKNTLEKGIEENLSFLDFNIHLILGGECFPESFRSYLAHILKVDLDTKDTLFIGSSFGIAEIGLNLLFETQETIHLRRKACLDNRLKKELFRQEISICPMLFQYNPLKVYMEEYNQEILFTNLNPKAKLPIIRYATGDRGSVINFEQLKETLTKLGLKDYIPSFKLPLVALYGRKKYLDFSGKKIYPDLIKEVIYSDLELPKLITGYFRMAKIDNQLCLEIQVKENKQVTEELKYGLQDRFTKTTNTDCQLVFYPYHEFPYGMELDYERKFRYI